MTTLKSKPEHALMVALNFTDEELALNRDENLSDEQKVWLTSLRNRWLKTLIASTIFGILFLMIGMVREDVWIWIWIILIVGPGSAYLIAVSGKIAAYSRDIRLGRALMIEGRVILDISGKEGNLMKYLIKAEGLTFVVSKTVFLAFKNGDPYRIYYTPYTKQILSAEWLLDDPFR